MAMMGHRLSNLRSTMDRNEHGLPLSGNLDSDSINGNLPSIVMGGSSSMSGVTNNSNELIGFEGIYSATVNNGNPYSNTEFQSCESRSSVCGCSEDRSKVVSDDFRNGTNWTLSFVCGKRSRTKSLHSTKEPNMCGNRKKLNHWVLKFNCNKVKNNSGCSGSGSGVEIPEPNVGYPSCVCTGYRRTEDHHLGAGVVFGENYDIGSSELIDMTKFNPEDYPIEDCDERARLERAREIAEGVEPPPGFCPGGHIQLLCPPNVTIDNLTALIQTHLGIHPTTLSQLVAPSMHGVHTQIDYIHCLVPDLLQITSCSFYWGKMDRYEAERLLEGRPEGTFLLRDSAQEEYLFSVSFRKYGRSLHARIEQWNHNFSFDSHDPGVFASPTVCGLIEHYKDPSCCMFFEPLLTIPLHRTFTFTLHHLCRAVVCSKITYDGINQLRLPKSLKGYLKEYHYRQRIRVRIFDSEH